MDTCIYIYNKDIWWRIMKNSIYSQYQQLEKSPFSRGEPPRFTKYGTHWYPIYPLTFTYICIHITYIYICIHIYIYQILSYCKTPLKCGLQALTKPPFLLLKSASNLSTVKTWFFLLVNVPFLWAKSQFCLVQPAFLSLRPWYLTTFLSYPHLYCGWNKSCTSW